MNLVDPIILTAYLLCIAYFLYRIVDAFNDEFTVRLDEAALKQELEKQNLQDIVSISFGFDKRYEFDKLTQIAVNIGNKSEEYSIYVDWDCSALTEVGGGRSRRVTRLLPGNTLDLFQNQVFSTVAPKTTLKEKITAEDLMERKGDTQEIKPTGKPLIPPDVFKKNDKFMKRYSDLEFFLGLAFRVVGPQRSLGGDRIYVLCKFIIHKLPWTAGLPWNPK